MSKTSFNIISAVLNLPLNIMLEVKLVLLKFLLLYLVVTGMLRNIAVWKSVWIVKKDMRAAGIFQSFVRQSVGLHTTEKIQNNH